MGGQGGMCLSNISDGGTQLSQHLLGNFVHTDSPDWIVTCTN